jgi:hypothetical protein
MINLNELIRWLGPDGAIAGLAGSDLTVAELLDLATAGRSYSPKIKRLELIKKLVLDARGEFAKTPEELIEMNAEELKRYFSEVKASRAEILEWLVALDIRPGSAARNNLADFAAREISDIGMYRRVAKGHASRREP